MGARVAVAGASGYGGGELLRLLSAHPEVELASLAAGGNAGRRVTDVHPHLRSLAGRSFDGTDAALLADADAVLLSLPHGQSAALAGRLPDGLPVLDLGADFRLADAAAWQRFYGGEHAGTWAYGLPELPGQRERLTGATRVALPGCYATTVLLALAPLVAAGLVDASDLVVVAASGVSGAGRTGGGGPGAADTMGGVSAYKPGAHQHAPEIVQALEPLAPGAVGLSLTPLLVPMARGLLATCTARTDADTASLRQAVQQAYAVEPLVHVLAPGEWPHTAATLGSGSAHVQVTRGEGGRAVAVAALDNLGKGASAQAVQMLNLLLGLPETTGVPVDGVAP